MAETRRLGIFTYLLIHFCICFNSNQAAVIVRHYFNVEDIEDEPALIPSAINISEIGEKVSLNDLKYSPRKRRYSENRRRRYDAKEENLHTLDQDNIPILESLGKYFIYINCTTCKVKSELVINEKDAKNPKQKKKGVIITTKKGLNFHQNRNYIHEGEKDLGKVVREHDKYGKQGQETYQKENETEIIDTKAKNTNKHSQYAPLHFITDATFKDGKIYLGKEFTEKIKEHMEQSIKENSMKKDTTGKETTKESTEEGITDKNIVQET